MECSKYVCTFKTFFSSARLEKMYTFRYVNDKCTYVLVILSFKSSTKVLVSPRLIHTHYPYTRYTLHRSTYITASHWLIFYERENRKNSQGMGENNIETIKL